MVNQHTSRGLRVGIIGAGQIVEGVHLPILKSLPGVTVAWISDTNPQRAQYLGSMYRVPALSSTEIEPALTRTDVCLVAAPLGARRPYLEACSRHGVAVYVEKPFARTRQEHDLYVSWFPPHRLAVGFQRRFYQPAQTVLGLVAGGHFGHLLRVEAALGDYSLKSGGANRYITNRAMSGGGVIIEVGIHILDHLVYTMAARDVRVLGVEAVVLDQTEYDAVVTSRLDLAHAPADVVCHFSRLAALPQGFVYTFQHATLRFGLEPDSVMLLGPSSGGPGQPFTLATPEPAAQTVNQAFYCCWRQFLDGVRAETSNSTSAVSSRLTTGWVEDIYGRFENA